MRLDRLWTDARIATMAADREGPGIIEPGAVGTLGGRITVEECVAGVTREATRALGRLAVIGTIEPCKSCDLAIWNVERPAELVYRIGFNPLEQRVWRGQ
jgi:imidazolonepropionase-like amidohydrolase